MRVSRPQAKPRKIKPKYGSARLRTSIIGRFAGFSERATGVNLARCLLSSKRQTGNWEG